MLERPRLRYRNTPSAQGVVPGHESVIPRSAVRQPPVERGSHLGVPGSGLARGDAQKAIDQALGKWTRSITDSEWDEIEQVYETQRLKRFHLDLPLYQIRKQATRTRKYQAFVTVDEPTFMEIRILLVDGFPGAFEPSYVTTMSGSSIHSPVFTDAQRQGFIDAQQRRAEALSE